MNNNLEFRPTYFKSRKGIKKHLVEKHGFQKHAIEVAGEGNSTYLYMASKYIKFNKLNLQV